MDNRTWQIKNKLPKSKVNTKNIIDALLANRGLEEKIEKQKFFNPTDPQDITLSEIGIKKTQLEKSISRIKNAIKKIGVSYNLWRL